MIFSIRLPSPPSPELCVRRPLAGPLACVHAPHLSPQQEPGASFCRPQLPTLPPGGLPTPLHRPPARTPLLHAPESLWRAQVCRPARGSSSAVLTCLLIPALSSKLSRSLREICSGRLPYIKPRCGAAGLSGRSPPTCLCRGLWRAGVALPSRGEGVPAPRVTEGPSPPD